MKTSAVTTPPAVPNHGVVSVAELAANPARFDGGRVSTSGTYIDSMKTLYDSSGIVSMGVPGPIAGAAGIKVSGLTPAFIDGLSRDEAYGTRERWGDVLLSGTVSVTDGVGLLKVDGAEHQPPTGPVDEYIDDDEVGTIA